MSTQGGCVEVWDLLAVELFLAVALAVDFLAVGDIVITKVLGVQREQGE